MYALFSAIRAVVANAIQGNWGGMGTSIVDIVSSALHLTGSVAAGLLRLLGML